MSRISLVEAYDNRDVIGQLVRLREDVNELQNILKDIDPDGDLTNVVTKTGDQTIDGIKTFIGKIVADCDIIQNGAAYETHAEQIYSHNDYLIMRDGALNGLAAGTYSGLQVKKYNGSDDVRMVVDNTGIMRVGDINDEKPLLVRDEAADLTSGNILTWDGVNQKAITSGKAVSDLVEGSGNIGDDTKPVKIVNGVATAVTHDLLSTNGNQRIIGGYLRASGFMCDSGSDISLNDTGSSRAMYVSAPNENRTCLYASSAAADMYTRLELRMNSNGTATLVMQKRKLSDDSYISDTTLATL